jgi:hypothetical protein
VGDLKKLWRRGQKIKEEMILCNFYFLKIFPSKVLVIRQEFCFLKHTILSPFIG